MQILTKSIKYLGHIISEQGIAPDMSKIEAITKMPIPKDKNGVQRLLGMATYVSKFIPNFSEVTAPLRSLLKKDVHFDWQPLHQNSFEILKTKLSNSPILKFYDVNKETIISVDASKDGLGAVIMQENLPCAYASKTMSETQSRYAQIEKELLAICFGVTRFNNYIYGKKVTVETDHQPLITIFNKPLNKCPARLQRMLLHLQKYDLVVKYKPGKNLF